MTFLTARWSDLLLVTYVVPADALTPHLHPALEPDLWGGVAHVSLVAFRFLDTRIVGMPVPGYVRHGSDRGVMFVREFVPSRVVAGVARLLYNEPYEAAHLTARVDPGADGSVRAQFDWQFGGGVHRLVGTGSWETSLPTFGSDAFLTKEHEWGFGRTRSGRLLRYRVRHPEWPVRAEVNVDIDVDFGALYGSAWAFLNTATPDSVIFAVGSAVVVDWPEVDATTTTAREPVQRRT
jgi:uncharacterized protein YqjF (DUF2071 family)